MTNQHHFATIKRATTIRGVGLHCGQTIEAQLLPAREPGIFFRRRDLPASHLIPADLSHVATTTHATTLQAGDATVSTTEHLLAALWVLGVTHCVVSLDGPEVPILDGSALDWCRLIEEAGLETIQTLLPRPIYTLKQPVWFCENGVSILGLPHHELRLSVAVDFGIDYLGRQSFDTVIENAEFRSQIALARTFTLQSWIEPLRAAGLIKGGHLENAIVLDENGPSTPWRFEDEIVRHKALDVLGDIALLFASDGARLQAHLIAIKGGHGAHRHWMNECRRQGALVKVDA